MAHRGGQPRSCQCAKKSHAKRSWRKQRNPSHLCPLGCVLTTAPAPGDPTQTSRGERGGRGGTREGQGHFSGTDGEQTNDIRRARVFYGLLTLKTIQGKICEELDMIKTLYGAFTNVNPRSGLRWRKGFRGHVWLSEAFHLAV